VKRPLVTNYIFIIFFIICAISVHGQEHVAPIRWNPFQNSNTSFLRSARITATTLNLPFFEDFTGYSASPDSNKWADNQVYINNTMAASPISRGVATFDDLNANGIPYDSFSNTARRYADTLTSQPIDLSSDSSADSIYLSFFYQPQGNGFFPLLADSLIVYLKNRYNDFVKVWAVAGTPLQPFRQAMIPVTDSFYFHNTFQIRFVNIAALNWADAVWNVDYVRLDKNRSIGDTAVTDIAFTSTPTFLLNDYTSMPYNQFKVSPASEIVPQVSDSIRNNSASAEAVDYGMTVRDLATGSLLASSAVGSTLIGSYMNLQVVRPLSIAAYPTHPPNTPVIFETKYFLQTTSAVGPVVNDTAVRYQHFDNYLAYDDGTAEKSYYLSLSPSLPGKIAIEFHLNKADTLRGLAIYFGRQIPFSASKLFAIYVYSALAKINGAPKDVLIDSTDLLMPAYADSVNHFWYYTFEKPILLPAGTFYAGTLQPLGGISDSLYFGLDVNRIGDNHAYYNVTGDWSHSLVSGAIMMRPLLGRYVSGSSIHEVDTRKATWSVFPNPATNRIQFRFKGTELARYRITDVQGHVSVTGMASNGGDVDISQLSPGMYFVSLIAEGMPTQAQTLIKL
jgi:hypothetical protein